MKNYKLFCIIYLYTYFIATSLTDECIVLITACPIEGQIRRECASHPDCHRTCNDTGPRPCPLICIPNGCECPPGTVINEAGEACITPNQCEGT